MTTDLYAKCPCGSGKKIKFCCKDIITDIQRIERMLQGDQRNAALEKINKLLSKHPGRPALLSMKARVFLELQQAEDAKPVIDSLLESEPDNPAGLAMKATISSAEGDMAAGLAYLHQALRASDGVLSEMVYRAYVAVCFHLIQEEELLAAYAHLLTLVSITKGQDRASVSMLMNVTSSERLPAIFQGLMIQTDAPEGVSWKREFDVAIDMYRHGDWTQAASMFENMNGRILDEPILLRNQAILQAWTCNKEKALKAFRYYAAIRSVDESDAVEAEACVQVLDEVKDEDSDAIVVITCEVDDAQATMEKLLSAENVESVPVRSNPDTDQPPPKGQFVFFDGPLPDAEDSEQEVKLEDLPHEIGSLTLFGKQTDRNARLSVVMVQDEQFDERVKTISEITGETISAEDNLEIGGRIHKVERLFRSNFRMPPTASLEAYQKIQQQWITKQLKEHWPNISLAAFDGKSAKEAAAESKLQRRVLAGILNLEIWADRQPFEFDFDDLRTQLGLDAAPVIDPDTVNIRNLSPAKLLRIDLAKLSDDDLRFVFEVVSVRPNGKLLRRIGEQILSRESMSDHVDLIEVHERMADLASNTDDQLAHLGKARDLAVAKGDSPGSWLVAELDVRIQRGESDAAKRLITEIQSRYMREPGIGQMFAAVLSKYGLMPSAPGRVPGVSPESVEVMPAEVGAAAAAPASGGVWTPDGSSNPNPPGDEGQESKLWVPGMD